jgi:CysZ protein
MRKANQLTVFLCGLIIAGLASVPILILVTPLFATGFMVRMFKRLAAKSGLRLSPQPAG